MTVQQPLCGDLNRAFKAIDAMMERVDHFKVDPQFTEAVQRREGRTPNFDLKDEEILGRLIALIAFSNNANAAKVSDLLKRQVFTPIFEKYSVEKTAARSADDITRAHWHEIKAIRFKYKVDAMVNCARCLLRIRDRHGSFMGYLKSVGLPSAVKSEVDVRVFWSGFRQIRSYFQEIELPYFCNFTSLCHLLMDRGFDCAKPDSAVMKAAVDLGIVPPPPTQRRDPRKTGAHPEESLRKAVETIQAFAISRDRRVPVMDLYFLVKGGQSGVREYIQSAYYS